MGYGDSPLYNPDSKAKMPNLDALAATGMRFTDAHTPAAVCAPTRYSILSGNYPWRSRTHEGVWHFNGNSAFLDGQRTIANELQDAGYNTAMIGKSHLGGLVREKGSDNYITERWGLDWTRLDLSRRVDNDPTEKGFNYTFLSYSGIQGQPFAFFENGWLVGNHEDLFLWKKGDYYDDQGRYEILIDGFGLPEWKSHTSAAVLYDAARSFLDAHFAKNAENDTQTPFFLHYCTPAVHLPHTPPNTFHGVPIKGASGSTEHVDMLFEVDVALGMLMDELEARGQLDNTLIIFVSDNGGLTYSYDYGHNSNAPLRRSKAYIYEGGHRVPMVVRWGDGTPGGSRIQPNSTADQLVAVQDLYATIADIIGLEVAPDQALDSRSIAPVLLENSAEPVHEYMLFQDFYRFGPQRAIREGSWKLISGWNGGALELYDLATDLGERNNLVDDPEQAERIERMLSKLDEMIISDRTTPSLKAIVPVKEVPKDLNQPDASASETIALIAEQSVELKSDLARRHRHSAQCLPECHQRPGRWRRARRHQGEELSAALCP
jgi:arylsulfatase A